MPRFFLHTHDGVGLIRDEEGSELPDLSSARAEALAAARQLWAASIIAQGDLADHRFDIADESGHILLVVWFMEALPASLRSSRKDI